MIVVRYVDVGSWSEPDNIYFQKPPGDPPMIGCYRYRVTVELPDFEPPNVDAGDAKIVSVEEVK